MVLNTRSIVTLLSIYCARRLPRTPCSPLLVAFGHNNTDVVWPSHVPIGSPNYRASIHPCSRRSVRPNRSFAKIYEKSFHGTPCSASLMLKPSNTLSSPLSSPPVSSQLDSLLLIHFHLFSGVTTPIHNQPLKLLAWPPWALHGTQQFGGPYTGHNSYRCKTENSGLASGSS